MGAFPDYYATYVAARWMRVPVWDLEHKAMEYSERAFIIMKAENRAIPVLRKRAELRAKYDPAATM